MTRKGPDVSFYQNDRTTPQGINFEVMARQVDFVIIRAGQNAWVDPDFDYNWREAKVAGLKRGVYWFYDSRFDPIKQAELLATCIRDDMPEMEVWLDLEESYKGPYTGYVYWKKFLQRLMQLLPTAKIGIYTRTSYIAGKIPAFEYSFFKQFVLWLAHYTANMNDVIVPPPWTSADWLFWQWGTPSWGIMLGCESIEIDMNLWVKSNLEFDERYKYVQNPGEPMADYAKLIPSASNEYRSVRNQTNYPTEPHILGSSSQTQRILAGNTAKANLNDFYVYVSDVYVSGVLRAKAGDKWWKVYEANGTPMTGWAAEIHLGVRYLNVEIVSTPSSVYPVSATYTMSDGSTWTATNFSKQ